MKSLQAAGEESDVKRVAIPGGSYRVDKTVAR